MNRRNFLSLLGLGVAGVALEQAIPLGRVWSFPKEIVVAKTPAELAFASLNTIITDWERDFIHRFKVGDVIRIRAPQHFLMREDLFVVSSVETYPTAKAFLTKAARLPS